MSAQPFGIDTSRRTILGRLPPTALSVSVLPTLVPSDPVLGVIAQHKAAFADWVEHHCDRPTEEAVWDEVYSLYCAVIRTQPTTLAGARALLEYALERTEEDDYPEDFPHAIRAVLDSRVLAA